MATVMELQSKQMNKEPMRIETIKTTHVCRSMFT